MEDKEGCLPLFYYTREEKQEIWNNIKITKKIIDEDVESIKDWFYKQPHLSEAGIDTDYIERMLVITKGSRETTKQRIDLYYKLRGLAPELILSRNKVLVEGSEEIFTFFRFSLIPELFNNKRIHVFQFLDVDLTKINYDVFWRSISMLTDLRLKYDYNTADIYIIDLNNTNLSYLLRINPVVFYKSVQMIQDAIGLRVHSIHCINPYAAVQQGIAFFTKVMNQKVLDRITVHNDVKELHDHIPKSHLPKDYGGDKRSVLEYSELFRNTVLSGTVKQYLIEDTKKVSNERKRPEGEEFMAGTFKKLDLD